MVSTSLNAVYSSLFVILDEGIFNSYLLKIGSYYPTISLGAMSRAITNISNPAIFLIEISYIWANILTI